LIVPLRRGDSIPIHRTKGFYRKQLKRDFPSETYHQRVIVESIFSAVKRRFGCSILAKKFHTQKNELMFRFMAYNAEKLVNLSPIEVYFLQS